jgi:hypothetical protein
MIFRYDNAPQARLGSDKGARSSDRVVLAGKQSRYFESNVVRHAKNQHP